MIRNLQKSLIAAIDQSTTSTKCQIFDLKGSLVAKAQKDHHQITPHQGWVEHDASEIISNLNSVIEEVSEKLNAQNLSAKDIATLGITNQRETVVAWSKSTGKPFMNAVVWNDQRTIGVCKHIISEQNGNKNAFKNITGLPINTYFSAFKIKWMLQNCEALADQVKAQPNDVLFGTMDSWVLWNLTKGQYSTDVSNASRTFLFDLKTLDWDQKLLDYFGVTRTQLPQIKPSGSHFGEISHGPFEGVQINSILGDQMAAAIGHGIFNEGQSKNTYGTGLFLLANIGEKLRIVEDGLLTSVLYQNNKDSKPVYCFEGAVECGGSTINWARDKMNFFTDFEDLNQKVSSVQDAGGIFFVPAFSGLFSPFWDEDASGTIIGLSLHSQKEHILRALFEAICFRTKDVINTMENAAQITIDFLNVDGGITSNELLMQMQSDVLQKNLIKPKILDATCLGTALFAALNSGIYKDHNEVKTVLQNEREFKFNKEISDGFSKSYKDWQRAIQRSREWHID